jgi:hypothetical protein
MFIRSVAKEVDYYWDSDSKTLQAAEKRPSAAFPSSFVVAAYVQVRLTRQDFGRIASGLF